MQPTNNNMLCRKILTHSLFLAFFSHTSLNFCINTSNGFVTHSSTVSFISSMSSIRRCITIVTAHFRIFSPIGRLFSKSNAAAIDRCTWFIAVSTSYSGIPIRSANESLLQSYRYLNNSKSQLRSGKCSLYLQPCRLILTLHFFRQLFSSFLGKRKRHRANDALYNSIPSIYL